MSIEISLGKSLQQTQSKDEPLKSLKIPHQKEREVVKEGGATTTIRSAARFNLIHWINPQSRGEEARVVVRYVFRSDLDHQIRA
jgi:hypothetical protein